MRQGKIKDRGSGEQQVQYVPKEARTSKNHWMMNIFVVGQRGEGLSTGLCARRGMQKRDKSRMGGWFVCDLN